MYLICDLDGTLLNSAAIVTECMDLALRECVDVKLDQRELLTFLGPPLTETICKYARAAGFDEQEMIRTYRKHYMQRQSDLAFYPQALELLQKARANSVRLAVATSKPAHATDVILERLGVTELFDSINCAKDDQLHTKTDLVLGALKHWNMPDPSQVLMVGDRIFDIHGAAENGIDTVIVTWGQSTQPDEIAQAWASAASADEVLALLQRHSAA